MIKRVFSLALVCYIVAAFMASGCFASAADVAETEFDFKVKSNWDTYVYSEDAEYLNSNGVNRTFYYSKNNGTQVYIGYTKSSEDYDESQVGQWAAFKLNAIGCGSFEATLYNYESISDYFKGFDIYMIPASETELSTDEEMREYIWNAINSGNYPAVTSLTDNASPHTFDVTLDSTGDYLLVIRRSGEDRNRVGFTKLTFAKKVEVAPASEYKFDFTACSESKSPTYGLESTEPSKIFSSSVTGNAWSAFVFKEDVLSTNSAGTSNKTFVQTKDTNLAIEMKDSGDWVSLLLPIGEGNYDAVLKSGTNANYLTQGNHELYFIPITKSELSKCDTDEKKRAFTEKAILDRTYYATTTPRIPMGDRPTEFSFEVNMPQGADYLVFVIKKTGLGSSSTANALHLSSLSLIKQNLVTDEAHNVVKLYTYAKDGKGEVSGKVEDVLVGTEKTVAAIPNAGYEFSHWADASGDFVSEKISYTFTPFSNTVLVAVFREMGASDEAGIDFYNANRDYLGFVPIESGNTFSSIKESAPTPEMTGLRHIG